MATGNTLTILNQFSYPITIYVSQSNWNCCDNPLQGQQVGYVAPGASVQLPYCRKDGHGCDGEQGYFQLDINVTMTVALNFDSNGAMGNPNTNNCNAAVSQLGSAYQLIVYA